MKSKTRGVYLGRLGCLCQLVRPDFFKLPDNFRGVYLRETYSTRAREHVKPVE